MWYMVEKWLQDAAEHSTLIGKMWTTFFFVLRMLMVISIADTIFKDEQKEFVCNTLTPGCANICFNDFSPVSLLQFWALQVGTKQSDIDVYRIYINCLRLRENLHEILRRSAKSYTKTLTVFGSKKQTNFKTYFN